MNRLAAQSLFRCTARYSQPFFFRGTKRFFSSSQKYIDEINVIGSLGDDNEAISKMPRIQQVKQNGFVVGNIRLRGGVFLINGAVFMWDVQRADALLPEHFSLLDIVTPLPELLIIGTGEKMVPLSVELKQMMEKIGVQVEIMGSKRASSTYNILLEEDRKVAAALLPLTPVSAREYNSPEDDRESTELWKKMQMKPLMR